MSSVNLRRKITSMIEKDYQFKRLLLREKLEEVYNLIADVPKFVDHYPNHKKMAQERTGGDI